MGHTSFADHLAGLDDDALVALLRLRPDACVEPVPSDMGRFADRLCSPASVAAALPRLDHDSLAVGRAIALLGRKAGVPAVADLLDASEELVERAVGELVRHGLAWPDGTRLRLPDRVTAQWQREVGFGSSLAKVETVIPVEEMRRVAEVHDIDTRGLHKGDLVAALSAAWSDRRALADRIARLPESARDHLLDRSIEYAHLEGPLTVISMNDRRLAEAGLLLRSRYAMNVPREVAVAAWLTTARLTGPPDLPAAAADDRSRASAEAAAHEALRLVTTVLDDAAASPIPSIQSGGIGKRDRARLVKRLGLADDAVACLILDVAFEANLLGAAGGGWAPTKTYSWWREQDAAVRWATLATAWFALPVAPTARLDADGKEVPPPLRRFASSGGIVRRALLAAASPVRSVAAAAVSIDWFCPRHSCDPERLTRLVDAARREAEWLGAIAGDGVTVLGRALVGAENGVDVVTAAAELLVDARCEEVVLQSDLTAVVSGRPDADTTRLLTLAADPETRGTATTYRFSPASVRRALDAGWDADGLRAALAGLSDRPLPQPLDYLVGDVARRHGEVHVRTTRTCVVADEALTEELSRARALRSLGWSRLAPTVLCSAHGSEKVLAGLRAAGYFPVVQDDSGAVAVNGPPSPGVVTERPVRASLTPEALVARLREDAQTPASPTAHLLAELNPRLDGAELDLHSDAIDRQRRVHLTYRDQNGTVTYRIVTPERLMHRWLVAWCHLRNGDREFTVASILNVAPPSG